MSGPHYSTVVLFGGAGFIGSHLARHLMDENVARHIVIADLQPPRMTCDRTSFVQTDVRREIPSTLTSGPPDLIVNLAAIHREPGHDTDEYFETNIFGAENVCRYATRVRCATMIFTSSIAVYGPTEQEKNEHSLTAPTSAYGASKLVAERIHLGWQESDPTRRLVLVRPGVVFGPGEGGNVTRLVRAVTGGYFVFTGNRHVRKAGGYVKELCNTTTWAMQLLRDTQLTALTYNFTSSPTPRLDEFVAAIAEVAGRKSPTWSIPYLPLLAASHFAQVASRVARIKQPLHPLRARKLVHSNHISSAVLAQYHYEPRYTLTSALLDWKRLEPAQWRDG